MLECLAAQLTAISSNSARFSSQGFAKSLWRDSHQMTMAAMIATKTRTKLTAS
jgi:hypothetical protein